MRVGMLRAGEMPTFLDEPWGGGSGLGLLGVVAAQSSRYVGTALGFGCVANTVFKLIAAGATSLKGL
jgi:hypothetical protein